MPSYRNKDRKGEEQRGVRNYVKLLNFQLSQFSPVQVGWNSLEINCIKITRMNCNPVSREDQTDLMVSSRQRLK